MKISWSKQFQINNTKSKLNTTLFKIIQVNLEPYSLTIAT